VSSAIRAIKIAALNREENPFASGEAAPGHAPPAPVSTVSAVLGILLCIYSVLQLGSALFTLLVMQRLEDVVIVVAVIASGGTGLVAGWRLAGRRRPGPWILVPLCVHGLIALLIVVVVVGG
jgi:hypothetical protein